MPRHTLWRPYALEVADALEHGHDEHPRTERGISQGRRKVHTVVNVGYGRPQEGEDVEEGGEGSGAANWLVGTGGVLEGLRQR